MQRAAEKKTDLEIHQKYITFSLGEEDYGIPVLQVLEIVKLEGLISIPQSKDFFLGMMDIRGHVLPVIDLKKKLGIQIDLMTDFDRAIIIETAGRKVCLAVDRVGHVMRFPPEAIDSGPPTIKNQSSRFITGVGKQNEQFVVLMTLDQLFTPEELDELFRR